MTNNTTTCPPAEDLRRYALGDYTDAQGCEIETHLSQCESCEATLADFDNSSDSLVRHLPIAGSAVDTSEVQSPWLTRLLAGPVETSSPALADGIQSDREHEDRTILGAYKLKGILGRGGMGVVYDATHRQLGRDVAIKVVNPRLVSALEAHQRFDREIETLGRLNHPGIVLATDAGRFDGAAYLVMERIDGVDLSRLVRETGPLTVPESCEIARQMAIAIGAAHAAGAVHRDIKPSNVMLDSTGQVKLLDFGLASGRHRSQLSHTSETSVGQLLGTLDFMAPEQAEGMPVNAAADIYGLAATLFYLLTGYPPRRSDKETGLLSQLRAIATEEAPTLRSRRADVPDELSDLVAKLLLIDPDKRFGGGSETARELERWCDENSQNRLKQLVTELPPVKPTTDAEAAKRSLSEMLDADDRCPPVSMANTGNQTEHRVRGKIGRRVGWILGVGVCLAAAYFATVVVLDKPLGFVKAESDIDGPPSELAGESVLANAPSPGQGEAEPYFETPEQLLQYVAELSDQVTEPGGATIALMFPAMTDDAINEMAGVMLQQIGVFAVLSETGNQTGGVIGESDGLPIMAPGGFGLLAQQLMDNHMMDDPPDVAGDALQRIIQGSINQMFGSGADSRPADRVTYQIAAGVLKSPAAFVVSAMETMASMETVSSDDHKKEHTKPVWKLERNGDRVTATDMANTSDSMSQVQLKKTSEGWKVESVFDDAGFSEVANAFNGVSEAIDAPEEADEASVDPTPGVPPTLKSLLSTFRESLTGQRTLTTKLNAAAYYFQDGDNHLDFHDIAHEDQATLSLMMLADVCEVIWEDDSVGCFLDTRSGSLEYSANIPVNQREEVARKFGSMLQVVDKAVVSTFEETANSLIEVWIDTESDTRVAFVWAVLARNAASLKTPTQDAPWFQTLRPYNDEQEQRWKIEAMAKIGICEQMGVLESAKQTPARQLAGTLAERLTRGLPDPISPSDQSLASELLKVVGRIQLDQRITARLILAQLVAQPDAKTVKAIFPPPAFGARIPYYPNQQDRDLESCKYYRSGWPAAANLILAKNADQSTPTEIEKRTIESLEAIVPLLTVEDMSSDEVANDLQTTADLLSRRLKSYYQPRERPATEKRWKDILPASPERLLTLIIQCGGKVPDFVRDGLPVSRQTREEIVEYDRIADGGLDLDQFHLSAEPMDDALQQAPFEVIRIAAKATKLPGRYTRQEILYVAVTDIFGVDSDYALRPPTDPILLSGVVASLAGTNTTIDESFAEFLTQAKQRSFLARHLKYLLDSNRHVGQVAKNLLVTIAKRTSQERVREAILGFDSRIRLAYDSDSAHRKDGPYESQ